MAEMLTYAPDLRSITGGQGEYTLEFLRYEEVPAHLAQKVVDDGREEEEAGQPHCSRAAARLRAVARLAGPHGPYQGHPHQPERRRLRHLRAHAAARRARRRRTSPAASAARSASCAPRARSTRAGSASPGGDDLELRHTRARRPRALVLRPPARAPRARPRGPGRDRRRRAGAPRRRRRRAAASASASSRERGRPSRAAPPAPRPRRADQRRPEDAARAGGLQRLRPHAHGRRRRPLARRPRVSRAPAPERPSVVVDHGHVGAVLVPLRGRPLRRGRRRPARRAGRRAVRARRRTSRRPTRPPTNAARCISVKIKA